MNKVERFTRDIRAGTVWVNTYNGLLNHMPFGGHKESGFGKDMGLEALEAVTVVKTVFNQFNLWVLMVFIWKCLDIIIKI